MEPTDDHEQGVEGQLDAFGQRLRQAAARLLDRLARHSREEVASGYRDYTEHARRLQVLEKAAEMPQAVWHLIRMGEQSVPEFAERLQSPDPVVHLQAAWALGQIGAVSAVERLTRALADTDANVRYASAEALAAVGDAAVPELIQGTSHGESEFRAACIYALGRMQAQAAADALGALLTDEDELTRVQAAWALGELRDPQAVAGLSAALRDPSLFVRRTAALSLAKIGGTEAIEALTGGEEATAIVQQAAVDGLVDLPDEWPRTGQGNRAKTPDHDGPGLAEEGQ